MMTTRQQRALQTKKKISTIAMKLFADKGFHNVTVDEIINKAESSKGAFYNHFKSKHDIFLEEFKKLDQIYEEILMPKVSKKITVLEKLTLFLEMQMTHIEENLGWDMTRTIYEHELQPGRESFFLKSDRTLYVILRNLCKEGKATGELREDITVEEMEIILVRAMRGILYDWSINKGAYSLKIEQKSYFDTVLRGLSKQN